MYAFHAIKSSLVIEMTDEEYVFRSECADRKRTARGSFNKRSHAGKGGRVKMPSDYMTKKERDKMNGEVQSYNLNSPMKWAQFKQMPDDIKREYLNSIISRYNPQQAALAEMFGISRNTVCNMFRELGIPFRGNVSAVRTGRNDAFWAWVRGAEEAEPEQKSTQPKPTLIIDGVDCSAEVKTVGQESLNGVNLRYTIPPVNGVLEFSNTTAQDAFNAAYKLLTTVELQKLVITWEASHE